MLVVLVLVLVVLLALWVLARRGVGQEDRSAEIEEVDTPSETVGYDVPQDAATDTVLEDLRAAGFAAVADPVDPRRLTIMLPLGYPQRDTVRAVLPGGSSRFVDE